MNKTKIIIPILTAAAIGWSGAAYADPAESPPLPVVKGVIKGYVDDVKLKPQDPEKKLDKPGAINKPGAIKGTVLPPPAPVPPVPVPPAPVPPAPVPTKASTTAGNLDVQITISNDCIVSNVDSAKAGNAMLNFGEKATLEKLIEANTSTNVSAVQITCSKGTTYNIGLGKGLYYDNGSRRMAGGGGAYIPYDLYRSASDTIPWGTEKGKDTLAVTTTTEDETQPITIYGKVPTMATKPAAGLYKDTVAISVVF